MYIYVYICISRTHTYIYVHTQIDLPSNCISLSIKVCTECRVRNEERVPGKLGRSKKVSGNVVLHGVNGRTPLEVRNRRRSRLEHARAQIYAYICIYIYVYIHMCIYMYMYVYVYTCICILPLSCIRICQDRCTRIRYIHLYFNICTECGVGNKKRISGELSRSQEVAHNVVFDSVNGRTTLKVRNRRRSRLERALARRGHGQGGVYFGGGGEGLEFGQAAARVGDGGGLALGVVGATNQRIGVVEMNLKGAEYGGVKVTGRAITSQAIFEHGVASRSV